MASGTSGNGSHSPGTNLASEHAIDNDQEMMKQDLPKKETQKVNHISSTTTTFNPLRLIPLSMMASGAAKLNSFSLARLPSRRRISSSPLPISAAKSARPIVSNNQNSPMPFQDLQGGFLITNYQDLPDSAGIYFTNSDRLLDMIQVLKRRVKAMMEIEGGSLTSFRDMLVASMASLEQEASQLNMQQSDADGLDAELRAIDSRKDIYNAICTLLASVCGAGVVIAAKVYPVRAAVAIGGVAAAASVVFLAVAKRTDSHHDELKIPVQKRKDIAEVIDGARKLAVGDLNGIMVLASYLKSHTESIMEMVDSGEDIESNAMVTELKQGFQELASKIERCSTDSDSARQAVVHTIAKCYPLATKA